ncbi:hypothetical protein HMPREF9080_01381 [Cardiobacterium valvarum F0432]|uniref:Uncharacterized protein n=1 Tax=Cardiobacterium valvarum F0432 TaxID=797473 RepID=G9ZF79_9GAMM|nr:hypothetical protein HMPREF9080_01381 [Cardiobacterium valvarum F0432]
MTTHAQETLPLLLQPECQRKTGLGQDAVHHCSAHLYHCAIWCLSC